MNKDTSIVLSIGAIALAGVALMAVCATYRQLAHRLDVLEASETLLADKYSDADLELYNIFNREYRRLAERVVALETAEPLDDECSITSAEITCIHLASAFCLGPFVKYDSARDACVVWHADVWIPVNVDDGPWLASRSPCISWSNDQ